MNKLGSYFLLTLIIFALSCKNNPSSSDEDNRVEFPKISAIQTTTTDPDNIELAIYSNLTDDILSDQLIKMEISRRVNTNEYFVVDSIAPSNTFNDNFPLYPDSIYSYAVRYIRKNTASVYTYSDEAELILNPPNKIRVHNVSPSSFSISWEQTNIFETDYKIYYKADFESSYSSTDILPENTFTLDGLNNQSQYQFEVRSVFRGSESRKNYVAKAFYNNNKLSKVSEYYSRNEHFFSKTTYSNDGNKIYATTQDGDLLIFNDLPHHGFELKNITNGFIYFLSALSTDKLFLVDEFHFYILDENGIIEDVINTTSNYDFRGTLLDTEEKSVIVYSKSNSNYLHQFDISNGVFLDSVFVSSQEDFNAKFVDKENRILIQVGKELEYKSYPEFNTIYKYELPEDAGIYGFEKVKGSDEFLVAGGGFTTPHFFRRLNVNNNNLQSSMFVEPTFILRYNISSLKELGLVFMGSSGRNPAVNIFDSNNSEFIYQESGRNFSSSNQIADSPTKPKTFLLLGGSDRVVEYTFDNKWIELIDSF